MLDIIKRIRAEYERQIKRNATEEDIKYHIIREIFLTEMGYDLHELKFEANSFNGRQDIITGTGSDVLTIETKHPGHEIEYKDIEQVFRYLCNKGGAWGLVTNGKQYILLNTKIKTAESVRNDGLWDNVVFDFDIYKPRSKEHTSEEYFKYLSHDSIFKTKVTNFFKDIKQFKVCSDSVKSWVHYDSTLYNFFAFLADEGKTYKDHRTLELINDEDFNRFIQEKVKQNKRPLSTATINNNWSHISSMMNTLKEKGFISYTPFNSSRNPNLEMTRDRDEKKINHLTTENIRKILYFYGSRRASARNTAAFLLCLTLGFERSDIIEFEREQVDFKKGVIYVGERVLKCSSLLIDCLKILEDEKIKDKNKIKYVFCTKRGGEYEKFKDTTLNDIFDILGNIGEEHFWKIFSPKYVKNWSVIAYFEANYPLDQIIYMTALEIKNLEPDHITTDMVYQRLNKYPRALKETEIFDGILNSKLTDWSTESCYG